MKECRSVRPDADHQRYELGCQLFEYPDHDVSGTGEDITGEGAAPGWGSGIPYWLWTIGVDALGLMCPVFAAYIAFSIADRPGIAVGMAGGFMALNIPTGFADGAVTTASAGFIGAAIAGLLGGIIAHYLKKIPLPKSMQSLKSIIIIPVIGVLAVGIIMFAFGTPIAAFMTWLEDAAETWLTESWKLSTCRYQCISITYDCNRP